MGQVLKIRWPRPVLEVVEICDKGRVRQELA
jgi:hypothetical protein